MTLIIDMNEAAFAMSTYQVKIILDKLHVHFTEKFIPSGGK
jgi:hypothetical protein